MNAQKNEITKHSAWQTLRLGTVQIQEKIANARAAYLAFCFILPVLLMYLIYLAMEIHPFGDGSVLVLDLNGQYVYFFEALRKAVYGEGSLLYSFFRALGGEFMGIYAYYLASPLSYIVALFPQEKMLEAMLTIILLKVGLCGFTFGLYLHKHSQHPTKPIVVGFSLMYALSAFAVVHQNNLMWTDAMIWLPLLVLGLEELIINKKYKLYVVSLAMTLMSNYYIGYMMCIFSVLYFFYFYFSKTRAEINPRKERLHFLRAGTRFSLFSILAAAIAGFVILAAYYSLTFGKNEFSNPNWSFRTNFSLLDFLTKFLPGSYDTVRPQGLPFVYCGILTVILIPVYFLGHKIRGREKIASLLLIGVFVLSFWIRPLELVWHGFQRPNWLNHRYSFAFCFLLLCMAYKGFDSLRRIGEKCILGICAFIVLFAAICEKLSFETYVESEKKLLALETVWLTVFATVSFLVLLCLWIRVKSPRMRQGVSVILCAVMAAEIFCNGLACVVQFDKDVLYSGYSGYNDYLQSTRPIVEMVKTQDNGFYRMEKRFHRKYNDNMALGIHGLTNSTSTLNASTLTFLNRMGYVSRSHLSKYLGGTPVSDSLLGIRYIIDEKDSDMLSHLYDEAVSDDHYIAYQNPYALSVAYGVEDTVEDLELTAYANYFERQNAIVDAMLGHEGHALFVPVSNETVNTTNCTVEETVSHVTYSVKDKENGAAFSFRIVAPYTGEYYFFPPTDDPREVILNVNGVRIGEFLGTNTTHIASIGHFEAGEYIKATLTLREDFLSMQVEQPLFWYLDQAVMEDAFTALQNAPQFEIDDTWTEDTLCGTISTAKENHLIQTSIPYDAGWKIHVDGQEVEGFQTMDALLAFRVADVGEHTLTLQYMPDIYVLGFALSVGGLTVFLLWCAADYILRKTKIKKEHPSFPLYRPNDECHEEFIAISEETENTPKASEDNS